MRFEESDLASVERLKRSLTQVLVVAKKDENCHKLRFRSNFEKFFSTELLKYCLEHFLKVSTFFDHTARSYYNLRYSKSFEKIFPTDF